MLRQYLFGLGAYHNLIKTNVPCVRDDSFLLWIHNWLLYNAHKFSFEKSLSPFWDSISFGQQPFGMQFPVSYLTTKCVFGENMRTDFFYERGLKVIFCLLRCSSLVQLPIWIRIFSPEGLCNLIPRIIENKMTFVKFCHINSRLIRFIRTSLRRIVLHNHFVQKLLMEKKYAMRFVLLHCFSFIFLNSQITALISVRAIDIITNLLC